MCGSETSQNGDGKVDGALLIAASVIPPSPAEQGRDQDTPKGQYAIGGERPACLDGTGTN